MNARTAKHMAAIRAASRPLALLTERDIALVIRAMCSSDGCLIDAGMPAGNVAVVQAEESGRRTAIFGSADAVNAFAATYGLTPEKVHRG